MSNVNKATQEIMAVFDEMYEQEMLYVDTFDAIASASASAKAVDNASAKAKAKAKAVEATALAIEASAAGMANTKTLSVETLAAAKAVEPLAGKRKLEQELEPDQVMTTEEAVMLALAASQYYTNQNTDGDYDGLARSGTFGLNVYKKARDVLKPKYKELFDVKAIAKRFKKLADNAWD